MKIPCSCGMEIPQTLFKKHLKGLCHKYLISQIAASYQLNSPQSSVCSTTPIETRSLELESQTLSNPPLQHVAECKAVS